MKLGMRKSHCRQIYTSFSRTYPIIQRAFTPWALSLKVKRPGREANHSPPVSAQDKNAWSSTFSPSIRLHDVVLI